MKHRLLTNLKLTLFLVMLCFSASIYAQGTISGKVVDENDDPVIGANVAVVGTTTGTITDADGLYSLEVPAGEIKLAVSFVGFLTENQIINVEDGQSQTINFMLAPDLLQLDDVVVIGYGVQRKSDLTGAVASVSSEDITSSATSGVAEALQGRAAGVQTYTTTGAPGANTVIRVRGITSINGNDPLWIVDGMPADPRSVNPNDVESIEILKDASTAAIYGSEGANGVILVTTKKGDAGKTSAEFNMYYGIQNIPKMVDVTSGPEFGRLFTEYEVLSRSRDYTFQNYDTLPTTDFMDHIMRQNAPMQSYNLGVSGGSENSTYYLGMGYVDQEGILRNSSYDKINMRFRADNQINDWLSAGVNVTGMKETFGGFEEWELLSEYSTPILMAMQFPPFVEVYDTSEVEPSSPSGFNWNNSPTSNIRNPVAQVELTHKDREKYFGQSNAYVAIHPIKGLRNETRVQGKAGFENFQSFTPTYELTAADKVTETRIRKYTRSERSWQFQNILSYNNTIMNDHNISLMAGFESGYYTDQWRDAQRLGLINSSPEMWYFNASLNDSAVSQLPSGAGEESSGYSYFGRISYDFRGMILGQVNFRRDYSSKFGPKSRYGDFPSFSVGFKFTELDVVRQTLPFMNFGKIRYGRGVVGNSAIDPYSYFATVASEETFGYPFGTSVVSATGSARDIPVDKSIHWEGVVTSNFGVDLGFFQNRLSLTVDYFERHNNEMLMEQPTSGHAGWIIREVPQEGDRANAIVNVGHLSNTGIEITSGWKQAFGKFNYSINANFTYLQTETGEIYPDTLLAGESANISGFLAWTIEGQSVGEFYGYTVERMFTSEDAEIQLDEDGDEILVVTNQPTYTNPETGVTRYAQPNAQPGDFKFKDLNGDGRIDDQDIGPIGNPHPKYLFGFNFSASYGWFDMSAFFQGTYGNKIFNATRSYLYNTNGQFNWAQDYLNDHFIHEDIVTNDGRLIAEANHDATYPRLDPRNQNQNISRPSSFFIEDGSYLRLKNLQIGVTIPADWTRRVQVENFRVYFQAQNLITWTKYSGMDPEIWSDEAPLVEGLDKASYPRARMYSLGLNVNF